MGKTKKTKKLSRDSVVVLEIGEIYKAADLPDGFVEECSHQGSCDNDVKRWSSKFQVKDQDGLKSFLDEYYEEDELRSKQGNLEKLLWIMACDIKEDGVFIFSH